MVSRDKRNVFVMLFMTAMLVLGALALAACSEDDAEDDGNNGDTGGDPAAACPGTLDESGDTPLCTMEGGEITEDATFIAGVQYLLSGRVFIGDGESATTLTIEPGATIYGDASLQDGSALIIQRNSTIMAEGTVDNPILFTSSRAPGERAPGDWGGVVINGNAPINICDEDDCEAEGEGATGMYGGTDAGDNSGTLRYARIEFSGKQLTEEAEFNGLTLQGVGSGTTIEYVQIHRVSDDSIEFFGGTAEVSHLLLTGCGDDGFDWTQGWSGKAEFVIIEQADDIDTNRGIEADSWGDNNDAEPRANPSLSNFTVLGSMANAGEPFGVTFRAGTAGTIRNMVIAGFDGCLDVDDDATWTQAANGDLNIDYSMVEADDCFKVESDDPETTDVDESTAEGYMVKDDFWDAGAHNIIGDPDLDGWVPNDGSPLLGAGDGKVADFIGAVGGADDDWTTGGWTDFPEN